MLTSFEEPVASDLDPELNDILSKESGWADVSSGLTRIFIGWMVLIVGIALGIGLLVLSAFLPKGPRMFWAFYLGLGILGVVGTLSYINLMAGQLRCLIHTPERNGVRWFIFTCMLCMALGPVANLASCFACTTQKPEFTKGVDGLQRIEFNATGRHVQAASLVGSIAYNICFIFYLRCIGMCFGSRPLMLMAEVYFVFEIILVGSSVYLIFFQMPWALKHPTIFVALAGGYLVQMASYLSLLLVARWCINSRLSQVRSVMGEPVFAA